MHALETGMPFLLALRRIAEAEEIGKSGIRSFMLFSPAIPEGSGISSRKVMKEAEDELRTYSFTAFF